MGGAGKLKFHLSNKLRTHTLAFTQRRDRLIFVTVCARAKRCLASLFVAKSRAALIVAFLDAAIAQVRQYNFAQLLWCLR